MAGVRVHRKYQIARISDVTCALLRSALESQITVAELAARVSNALHHARIEHELDAERTLMGAMLRSINDGVVVTTMVRGVFLMNPAAERLTGVSEREAIGRPMGTVLKIEAGSQGITCISASGQRTRVELSAMPIRDGKSTLGVVIALRELSS